MHQRQGQIRSEACREPGKRKREQESDTPGPEQHTRAGLLRSPRSDLSSSRTRGSSRRRTRGSLRNEVEKTRRDGCERGRTWTRDTERRFGDFQTEHGEQRCNTNESWKTGGRAIVEKWSSEIERWRIGTAPQLSLNADKFLPERISLCR
jgi:hypothetical protein